MCQASGDDINAVLESKLDYKWEIKIEIKINSIRFSI